MKKMTKGAIVTGLGVALLLGGGGTLAVWNTSAESEAGTIAAGNLDLTRAGNGVWTTKAGKAIDIASYRVVPGETLTFTQDLTVDLKGEEMKAVLTTGGVAGTAFAQNATISAPVLSTGNKVLTEADSGKPVTATTTFEFKGSTADRAGTQSTYDFGKVSYVLTQQAPSN